MFSDSIDLGGKFTYVLHQHKLGFGVKKVLHRVVEVEIQRFLSFKKIISVPSHPILNLFSKLRDDLRDEPPTKRIQAKQLKTPFSSSVLAFGWR